MTRRYFIVICFIAFFLFIDKGFAQENEFQTLESKKVDVTGDGKEDFIYVKGELKKEKDFYEYVFFEIETSSGQKHVIKQSGGYQPEIAFYDLNHDGLDDLFISVPEDLHTNKGNNYLYSFKNDAITEYTVPRSLTIQSELLDGYKAKILLDDEKKKTYTVSLEEQASEYEKLGIYQNNGMLNEPTELNVLPYSKFTPTSLKSGKHGLKGVQEISGANNKVIAYVEAIWSFDNGKGEWALIKTDINKNKNQ